MADLKRFPLWCTLWVMMAFAAAFSIGLYVLYYFDPETYGFYPRCQFFCLTGWKCPGCGTLRAVHQLLHGQVFEALRFNPYVFMVPPLIALLIFRRKSMQSIVIVIGILSLTFVWWVVRNIIGI